MVELTHKEGYKVLAYWSDTYKGYVDLEGYPLKDDCWLWIENV